MIKKILALIGVIIVITIISTTFLLATGKLKIFFEPGANKELTKTYDRDFRRLSLDFPADFTIKPSNENKVVISGGKNVLEFLNITQTSRTLGFSIIENDWFYRTGWSISGNNRPSIVIYTTKVEELIVDGESKLSIQNTNTEQFNLDFRGKQSVIIDQLTTPKAAIKTTGTGFVDISGKTDNLDLNASGTGRILLRNLEAKNATILANSTGAIEVFVTEKLSEQIISSGIVKYRGSPEINKKLSGTGDVIRL
ncbi:MAG: DUF2807 domain-containing protein [bacterium]